MNINFKKPINLDWALLQFSPKATGTVPHSYTSYIIYRCYLQVSMSYDIDTVRVSAPRGSQGPSNVFNIKVKLQVYSSDHISDCTLTYYTHNWCSNSFYVYIPYLVQTLDCVHLSNAAMCNTPKNNEWGSLIRWLEMVHVLYNQVTACVTY